MMASSDLTPRCFICQTSGGQASVDHGLAVATLGQLEVLLCDTCNRAFLLGAESTQQPRQDPAKITQAERDAIVAEMRSKVGRIEVSRVVKVHNPVLEGMFGACAENFRKMGVATGMTRVYHGTSRQAVGSIIRCGFNASLSGKAHGKALGYGVYASELPTVALSFAKVSADADRTQCMFICDALLGGTRDHKKSGTYIVVRREQQIIPRYAVFLKGKV